MDNELDNDIDRADLSLECANARRKMRAKLLEIGNNDLKSAYYNALMLSEHEAARLAVDRVLSRSSLSNKAEA